MIKYVLFACLFLFTSCGVITVEKRHFRKGYHISWNKTYSHNSRKEYSQQKDSSSLIGLNETVYNTNVTSREMIETKTIQIQKQYPIADNHIPDNQLVQEIKRKKLASPTKNKVETINSNKINVDSLKSTKVNPYIVGFGIAFIVLLVVLGVIFYITGNLGGIFPVVLLLIPSLLLLTMYTDGTNQGLRNSLLIIGILFIVFGLLSVVLGASGWFHILFTIVGAFILLLGITFIILRSRIKTV